MKRVMLGAALAAAVLVPAVQAGEGSSGFPTAGPRPPAGAAQPAPAAPAAAAAAPSEVEKRLAKLEQMRKEGTLGIGPSFQHVNDHENLRALFRRIRDLVRGGQYARASTLGATLLPDEARVKAGLRDNVSAAEAARIYELEKSALPDETYKIFAPDNAASEVRLYRATTEELANPTRGSAAKEVFPKNCQKLAREILRPGMTWYIVELALPGADQGYRYHLIFFDGAKWTMLGPIWAAK